MGNRFVSVICEYNPLHCGHAFMLERAKGEFGAAACILSGDIVQRGTPAVAPASVRAAAAVGCGANLVVSLPIPWCCSSARDFAAAGVHIARLLGSGALAFGAEDRPELLHAIAEFTSRPEFAAKVKELITREGNLSYPAAFRLIAEGALGAEAEQHTRAGIPEKPCRHRNRAVYYTKGAGVRLLLGNTRASHARRNACRLAGAERA